MLKNVVSLFFYFPFSLIFLSEFPWGGWIVLRLACLIYSLLLLIMEMRIMR